MKVFCLSYKKNYISFIGNNTLQNTLWIWIIQYKVSFYQNLNLILMKDILKILCRCRKKKGEQRC